MNQENHVQSTIGAGAVVIKGNQVLLVALNYGRAKGHWILPGGMVEEGEFPNEAASREVFEETNVSVKMRGVLAIRHRRQDDGRANTYYVFLANHLEDRNYDVRWPDDEIQEAKFWNIDEAIAHELVRPLTKKYVAMASNLDKPPLDIITKPNDQTYDDLIYGINPEN